MKIVIVGPVNTNTYFGGVAIFTEGLADAFKMLGHDVKIVTDYSIKNYTSANTEIISLFKKPTRKNAILPVKIKNEVMRLSPELVITSLEYGIVNKMLNNIFTIHYIHGFPSKKGNKINNFFINKITKFISRNSNYVIANSGLTSIINSEIFDINANRVINVAVGYDFINKIKCEEKENNLSDKKSVLFVGRLVKEKKVDSIIRAFSEIDRNDIILKIVGDGPEKRNLEKLAKSLSDRIIFYGKKSPDELVDFYNKSDVFISLNPHEPFGIVYLEALAANCTVICPKMGGQIDVILNYLDRTLLVNPYDIEDIRVNINEAFDLKHNKFDKNYILDNFSYNKSAKEIERIYEARKNV